MTDSQAKTPQVSIGMPVFNGENFLEEALQSILKQSFEDYELIICDNASTDRTGEICRAYAGRDKRILYNRHERNLGAAVNFNSTFTLARAPLFKWAAHDDLLEPDYLEQCVAALNTNRDAVLCHTLVRVIDERGESLAIYNSDLKGSDSSSVHKRFAALVLSRHLCTDMFGLIRHSAMAQTRKHGAYYGGDRSLLAELSLLGRFITIPEPLFMNREHGERFVRAVHAVDWHAWHDMAKPERKTAPTWQLYSDYLRAVTAHVADPRERARCYFILTRWWLVDWNPLRLAVDLISRINPAIYEWVRRTKLRALGKLPQARIR